MSRATKTAQEIEVLFVGGGEDLQRPEELSLCQRDAH